MFEVEDVDAEYERLKALDVEFVMLPTTHPWGARSFWFRDPDGNIVDFFANLAE
jgi:catechol 2,3-dioxygenase-like lactoylglutathione lyase family enzyme